MQHERDLARDLNDPGLGPIQPGFGRKGRLAFERKNFKKRKNEYSEINYLAQSLSPDLS